VKRRFGQVQKFLYEVVVNIRAFQPFELDTSPAGGDLDQRRAARMWVMGTKAWPSGQGEMAERICTHNWAATPLGPIPSWPQCLKTAVELMLASGFPTSIHWGPDAILLYNDAKARILGGSHPAALGKPTFDALPATRPGLELVVRRVMGGESVIYSDQRYFIQETGGEKEIWVDHLASPMRDETGAIAGLWMVLIDVTARIQAERQRRQAEDALRKSEARQVFLLQLSDALRAIAGPDAIVTTATMTTGTHFGVNRCCYSEICGNEILHRGSWGRDGDHMPKCCACTELATVVEGYLAEQAAVADDIESDPRFTEEERDRLRAAGIAAFVCVSLRKQTIFGLQSAAPRVWSASEVELIKEVAERTLHAVRRARTEAALRDSEERFRQFAGASTDIIWIRNAKTLQLEYWSPGFEWGFGDKWDPALGGDNLKDWVDIIVPEDRERALDTLARVQSGERVTFEYRIKRPRDGEILWIRSTVFPILDGAGGVQRIGSICHDTTGEKATAERMEIMVAELQHRTRNLMAVLQSIVAQTLAASEDLDSFKMRIDERLIALSRVQRLLSRSDQEPVTIGALVQLELDALDDDGRPGQIEVCGPEVRIRNSTVQMLALALHELAVDAHQHGALSTDRGRLRIAWDVGQVRGAPYLQLSWIEERPDGVAVKRDRRGYGRELIERALPYSLNAETCYELDGTGLRCTVSLPLTKEGPKERGA
jgi:PAS domain S-box-containing protein